MLAKIFSNKTLCLTTPEVDLAFDYDSLGAEACAASLGVVPKQFEGDIFTLIGLLGGNQVEVEVPFGSGLKCHSGQVLLLAFSNNRTPLTSHTETIS